MILTIDELLNQIRLIKDSEELTKEEKVLQKEAIINKTDTPIKEYLTIVSDFN